MGRRPPLDRSLETAAARYAARRIEIAELDRRPTKACLWEGDNRGLACFECPAGCYTTGGRGCDEHTAWWERTPEEVEAFCEPCRARVALWQERHDLKAGMGGLMRALLAAYRRSLQREDSPARGDSVVDQ